MPLTPQRIRILLVDDDELDRIAVHRALAKSDLEVKIDEEIDPARVVDRASAGDYDCLILDYELPGTNGLELTQALREAGVLRPILVLTGHGSEELAVKLMKAGASDYLSKARLDPARLARRLRALVRVWHAEEEMRQAQAQLGEERQLLETLHRIGGSLVTQLDSERLSEEVTEAATRLSGAELGVFYQADGAPRRRAEPGRAPEPGEAEAAFAPLVAEALRSGSSLRLGDLHAHPRGADAPDTLRSALVVPVTSSSGGVLGVLCFGHPGCDAFGEREERLVVGVAAWAAVAMDNARLYEAERRAARARDDMLSVVSHDLRNPLNAISIAVEELLDPELRPEERARYVGAIRRSVERSDALIRDLLDVGRIEAGRLAVEAAPVTVARLLEQSRSEHEMLAEGKGLTIDLRLDDQLQLVRADRERILQVLGNLIGNALSHTARGGRIELSSAREGDWGVLAVRDTGAGIDPGVLPHLFDRFWQAEHRGRAGAGLGLAICRGIVEAHGGTIEADSVVGEGSVFRFTLPAVTGER